MKAYLQRFFVILLLLATMFLIPSVKAGYYDKTIDVLVVEDEEFAGLFWYSKNVWYNHLSNVFDIFKALDVEFKIRGTISWDSNDDVHDLYYLLQEAIQETEYSRLMIYQGANEVSAYYIDLLIVFTGQDDPSLKGFSHPDWYALIISYTVFDQCKVMSHELGHQFLLQHCNNECAMNPNSIVAYFCEHHKAEIKANYQPRFWRWVDDGGGGGGGIGGIFPKWVCAFT